MAMVQAYQEMESQAGIKVDIINDSSGGYWDTISLKQPFACRRGSRTTPAAFMVAYRKSSKWNEAHFFRDDYDALLNKAATTVDPAAQRKL